jgi:hypothetical protein
MSESPTRRSAARAFATEFTVWALLAGSFLHLYAGHPAGGAQAIAPHLRMLCLIWLALACLRLAAWRYLPSGRCARSAAALLLGVALVLLLSYYALVLVGLWSWGRVISWELIINYAGQATALADSLDLSVGLIAAVAVACILAVFTLTDLAVTRLDWAHWASSQLRGRVFVVVLLGTVAGVVLKSYEWIASGSVDQREPLSLTFLVDTKTPQHLASRMNVSPELLAQAQADRTGYFPSAPVKRPNIVLVVVDALRPDRMTLYGHERLTTPYLMSLKRQGQISLAQRAVAACPESYCGLLAIARSKPLHKLTDQDLSLHEVLKRNGYGVEMILSGDHTHFYGLRQAYGAVDRFIDGSTESRRSPNDDEVVIERAKSLPLWGGQPQLLQFHLMSVHLLGVRDSKFVQFKPARPYKPWRVDARGDQTNSSEESRNHYDNGVLQMDDVLRRLIEALTERQYMRNTILVLTGDHGEMLGEHREYGHAKGVFEGAMRVPLVFAGFGVPTPNLDQPLAGPASQLDIGPTVLHEVGIPAPRSWDGKPLQWRLPPRQLPLQQGHLVGLYDSTEAGRTLKYVRHIHTGVEQVFDIDADPTESHNLLPSLDAMQLARLRQGVQPIAASVPN